MSGEYDVCAVAPRFNYETFGQPDATSAIKRSPWKTEYEGEASAQNTTPSVPAAPNPENPESNFHLLVNDHGFARSESNLMAGALGCGLGWAVTVDPVGGGAVAAVFGGVNDFVVGQAHLPKDEKISSVDLLTRWVDVTQGLLKGTVQYPNNLSTRLRDAASTAFSIGTTCALPTGMVSIGEGLLGIAAVTTNAWAFTAAVTPWQEFTDDKIGLSEPSSNVLP